MTKSKTKMAHQIAQAVSTFEQERTGQWPKAVTVIICEETLVITLHDALTPAEKALSQNPAGAAQVQEFHRQLFTNSCGPLRQEIERITGVEVREATAEVKAARGSLAQVFTSGTMVQVFLLAGSLTPDSWSGAIPSDPCK